MLASVLVVTAAPAGAGVKDPVEGDAFRVLIAAQHVGLQRALLAVCAPLADERAGVLVTGPMDAFYEGDSGGERIFHAVRVVCSDGAVADRVVGVLRDGGYLKNSAVWSGRGDDPFPGFRGITAVVDIGGERGSALVLTEQQNRWLVWVRDVRAGGDADVGSERFAGYARAVSRYLAGSGEEAPQAGAFGLPAEASLYPPRPPYVIEGYDNYKAYLRAHEDITTGFARGILGFVPGDSLRRAMAAFPPEKAWPNKEEPLIQHEYREFFERGGDTAVLRTLSAEMIPGLRDGEYFYCVGLAGTVRCGYEIPREEVERIETETGKKVARANHAFLFPGEPVLVAGAFVVRAGRIVEVDAHSGHYFYSNVTASVREDIAVHSDDYLMTLGHFLAAMERMGVETRGILMSKL